MAVSDIDPDLIVNEHTSWTQYLWQLPQSNQYRWDANIAYMYSIRAIPVEGQGLSPLPPAPNPLPPFAPGQQAFLDGRYVRTVNGYKIDSFGNVTVPIIDQTARDTANAAVPSSLAGSNQVYAKNASGVAFGLAFNTSAIGNTLAQRDGSGQVNVATTPTTSNHATSKSYVDAQIALQVPRSAATGANQVYIKDANGNPGNLAYAQGATGYAVPQRDVNGQINVPTTPTGSTHAASKSYVDGVGAAQVSTSAAAANQVHAKDASGVEVGVTYDKAKNNNTIVQRSATGTIETADPTADTHAATKLYVDGVGAAQVSLSAANANQVYFRNSSGTPAGLSFGNGVTNGALVQRDSSGQVNVPTAPTSTTHAASKQYVDTATADLALGGRFGQRGALVQGDLNDLTNAGFWSGNNLTNAPNGTSDFFAILVQPHAGNTNWLVQTATEYATTGGTAIATRRTWQRFKQNNVWSAWVQMTDANGAFDAQARADVNTRLRSNAADVGATVDLNTVTNGGWYLGGSGNPNAPSGSGRWLMDVRSAGTGYVYQRLMNIVSGVVGTVWERYTNAGTASGAWSAWRTVVDANGAYDPTARSAAAASSQPGHTHVSTDITDSSSVGRSLLTAADQATARNALAVPSWSITLTGTGYITGGGNLQGNRTFDLTAAAKTLLEGAYQKPSGGIPDADLASKFVKTVNGITPDTNGNVNVSGGGGGGSGTVNSVNGKGPDASGAVTLTPGDVSAVPLSAAANGMAFIKDSGSATGLAYSQTASGSSLAQRTSAGQLTVPTTPAAASDATSKQYTDAADALLVPIAAAASGTVFAKNGSGTVVGIGYGTSGTASNAIPQRQSNGQIAVPATPAATTDATSKTYVDSNFALIGRAIATGAGLKGGGTLVADRTISLDDSTQSLLATTSKLLGKMDLTGVNMWGMGNSWVASPTGNITQYTNRAATALNATYRSIATSGYRMQDSAVEAYSGQQVRSKAWDQDRRGVVVIGDLLNNEVEADTTQNRNAALEGMRALVALARSTRRIEDDDSSWSYSSSPSWLQVSQTKAWASGRKASLASATGAYVDFDLPVGVSYFVGMGTDPSSFVGTTVDFRRGTSTTDILATQSYNNMYLKTGYHSDGIGPVVTRLEYTQGSGSRIRAITKDANYFFADALLPQHKPGHGPLVFIVKPLPVLSPDYQKTDLNTFLRTVPDTVAAEFGADVVVVDPISGWNANTMLLSDQLHPNETGAAYLATTLTNAIQAELTRRLSFAINSALNLI